ncbi:phage tail protein [Ancylobacter vacuolatus]|uniref:Microcystin-dependent protein n=1 Tax=Ancylobacter vacuolatus TaxID=223389 RepID=A0ABU0DCL3_9HYPH|nr:tail fiber protein [Ancylobacter vacuolatus]MDQ0346155.1 microcystin-dependent protein [Ancylobacter vacuolatus]
MECYVGEIRLFAGKKPPRGWALCDGKLLPVIGNEALFVLLGATWGGDGHTSFALPDLRGRLMVGAGQGTGLTSRLLGAVGGVKEVTLTHSQIAAHKHLVMATEADATTEKPDTTMVFATASSPDAASDRGGLPYIHDKSGTETRTLESDTIGHQHQYLAGPHDNMMPALSINYIIALSGIYPQE